MPFVRTIPLFADSRLGAVVFPRAVAPTQKKGVAMATTRLTKLVYTRTL